MPVTVSALANSWNSRRDLIKIRLVPADHDAAGHYRCFFPAKALNEELLWDVQDAEHELVDVRDEGNPLLDTKYVYDIGDIDADTDLMVLHSYMNPNIREVVRVRRLRGVKRVYMLDDWIMNPPSWNPANRGIKNKWFLPAVVNVCHGAIASTPFIAEKMEQWNKNVRLIRNYLYWPMWEEATQQSEVDRDGRIRVGYMGSWAWRQGDLELLKGVVPRLLRRNPNVDFVAASATPGAIHDYLGVPEDRRVSVEGFSFVNNYQRLHTLMQFDIGLIPLATHEFNEAKSHLKGLEYNACGVPFVASNSESYRYYTIDGENGVRIKPRKKTKTANQWLEAIESLVHDDDARRVMGRRGREVAKANDLALHWNEWAEAYRSIA
jgi:glycosyltransferase involved in cell wall biosynthesis